jgi:hypothetical protein
MRKISSLIFTVLIFFSVISVANFGVAQTGTNVSSVITSDTNWTQAGSPYTFTGPVAVNANVNLTIQAGATVNIGDFYLQVNGSLIIEPGATVNCGFAAGGISIDVNGLLVARGTNGNPIRINGVIMPALGSASCSGIYFGESSLNWSEHTGSGCVIENTILNQITIWGITTALKINNNTVTTGVVATGDSSIISNNTLAGTCLAYSSIVSNNTINGGITARGSSLISNNTLIDYGIYFSGAWGENATIYNNTITGCKNGLHPIGIRIESPCPYGGSISVKENLIVDNYIGVFFGREHSYTNPLDPVVLIQDNTITNNQIGIAYPTLTSTIIYNNIQNNNQSIYAFNSNSNVTYNWWGTTDTQAINQTIYDYKYDFNLGNVTFVPFLSAPNPQAPIPASTPSPSPSPSPTQTATPTPTSNPTTQSTNPTTNPTQTSNTPSPTPSIPEIPTVAVLSLFMISLTLAIVLLRKNPKFLPL